MANKGKAELEFLMLFVAGNESNSVLARKNLDCIVKQSAIDPSVVKVVDVYEDYRTALDNRVFLTPTLLIGMSGSVTRVVGNLQDVDSMLHKLEIFRDA